MCLVLFAMNSKKTPFSALIDALAMNDYEIARRTGASRSTIRALRVGMHKEPGYSLGLKLADLGGVAVPDSLKELTRAGNV